MNLNETIYGKRSSGMEHGDVFTSPIVVCFMLDKVGYRSDLDLRNVTILEPSCGEGEFVVEIARRLILSAARFGFDAEEVFACNVRACDIDADKVAVCRGRIVQLGIKSTQNIITADFLTEDLAKTDIVVGNPPYVRYENIPSDMLGYCKRSFATFHYRSDLYIPFFEKSLSLLNKGGKHCFICSNRWIKNEYGKKLRQFIVSSYRLQMLIDMEQSDAFQENVLAYPAITLISAESLTNHFEYAECADVLQLQHLNLTSMSMPIGADWTKTFVDMSQEALLLPIEQQGFKIGIGVATGADAIFISDKLLDEVEPELLLPAINARDLKGDNFQWRGNYLLNPFAADGSLIDLDKYPKAKRYFETHRKKLSQRHVAKKSPLRWYKTIDRITPSLQSCPKVLLPDISGNTVVFVDSGNFYPLHNIYYISGGTVANLRVLAAILMSDFVRNQLASISTKMNGGFVRWQSRNLRKLQLPDIKAISALDKKNILESYSRKDIAAINVQVKRLVENPQPKTKLREMVKREQNLQFAF